jgi:hypothetical protein
LDRSRFTTSWSLRKAVLNNFEVGLFLVAYRLNCLILFLDFELLPLLPLGIEFSAVLFFLLSFKIGI